MTDRHHHPDDELLAALGEQWGRELWEPPGLRFEVGQRVRIRLSGECRVRWVTGTTDHPADIDGRAGTVEHIDPGGIHPALDSHPYLVLLDGDRLGPRPWHERHFAASELIPIADDDARPSAAREEG